MVLESPITGFDEFLLYREIEADDAEVILCEDLDRLLELGARPGTEAARHALSPRSYVLPSVEEIHLWLFRVGVHRPFIDRFVDLLWNWRLLRYDLRRQYLTIPDLQANPLHDYVMAEGSKWRVNDPDRDPFDPLNDYLPNQPWS